MTIPYSTISNVIPGVLSAGGQAVTMSGLVLSQNTYIPSGQVLQFANQAAVASYFGALSTEAQMATNYFSSYTNATSSPGVLLMALYPENATSGFLSSSSLASMTLTQLKALSGTLILTVGGTLFTSSSINLSSATSFSNAATLILAGFTSPAFTCVFDSTKSAFIFTTTATGATATITYATGTLSAGLMLTSATGAVLSQGQAQATPAAYILTINQNWGGLGFTWEPVLTEKEAFATWINSTNGRYFSAIQDTDINILTPNNTVTFGNWLQTNQISGVIPVYGNYTHTGFVLGWAASLQFSRLNGRTDLCYRNQYGLSPSVSDINTYNAVLSNGYNCYGAFGSNNPANNQNVFSPGSISGKFLWADSYVNQIWFNANLQLAGFNVMANSNSLPYNSTGYNGVYAAYNEPIQAAVNFGAIRTGVSLSSSQVYQIIQTLGFDASSTIYAKGYYLQIQPASPTTRAARQSPPMTLYYTDGQSIQNLVLASIEVQ